MNIAKTFCPKQANPQILNQHWLNRKIYHLSGLDWSVDIQKQTYLCLSLRPFTSQVVLAPSLEKYKKLNSAEKVLLCPLTAAPCHCGASGMPRASVTWPSCRFFTSCASQRLVVVSSFSTWAKVLSFSWSGKHWRSASLALRRMNDIQK